MLATHWPLFGLTVTRGSVTLRLPTDDGRRVWPASPPTVSTRRASGRS